MCISYRGIFHGCVGECHQKNSATEHAGFFFSDKVHNYVGAWKKGKPVEWSLARYPARSKSKPQEFSNTPDEKSIFLFRPCGLFSSNFFSLPLARGCGSVVCLFDGRPASEGWKTGHTHLPPTNDLKIKMGEIFSPFVQGLQEDPGNL